jgi:hypothetical protein
MKGGKACSPLLAVNRHVLPPCTFARGPGLRCGLEEASAVPSAPAPSKDISNWHP